MKGLLARRKTGLFYKKQLSTYPRAAVPMDKPAGGYVGNYTKQKKPSETGYEAVTQATKTVRAGKLPAQGGSYTT